MTTTVKISEAKTHLSDLLAPVEAGEDFVIARAATTRSPTSPVCARKAIFNCCSPKSAPRDRRRQR